jgi:hypothetical protein
MFSKEAKTATAYTAMDLNSNRLIIKRGLKLVSV